MFARPALKEQEPCKVEHVPLVVKFLAVQNKKKKKERKKFLSK